MANTSTPTLFQATNMEQYIGESRRKIQYRCIVDARLTPTSISERLTLVTALVALPSLCSIDWDDMNAAFSATQAAFIRLTNNEWAGLLTLLHRLLDNGELVSIYETNDHSYKIILHDDREHGFQVQLHVFRPGCATRPHNHHWSFASTILAGSCQNTQYSFHDTPHETTPESLHPLQVRAMCVGDSYVLHHTAVHSVTTLDGAISLVLSGPVVGAQNETRAQRDVKRDAGATACSGSCGGLQS